MTLLRLKATPFILIEDNANINTIPLIQELAAHDSHNLMHFFCYEQPSFLWQKVFKQRSNVFYHQEFDIDFLSKHTNEKTTVIVDSLNQMVLSMGWDMCLQSLKKMMSTSNIRKIIMCLHTDCLLSSSRIRINLNHIATAIISYGETDSTILHIVVKKSGKILKSDEVLSYDTKTSTLRLTPIVKETRVDDEPEKPLPQNLTTFKIEVDQTEKLEKYKLKLPYMSKIHEGESKIFYEPDAVDDWDEEDPDDDLDI